MKRGELWTVAGGPGVAGKPRPALIVQDDAFAHTRSITICPLTSDETEVPSARLGLAPTERNGLTRASHLMVDKLTTIPRSRLGKRIGAIDDESMAQVNITMMIFLGLAG